MHSFTRPPVLAAAWLVIAPKRLVLATNVIGDRRKCALGFGRDIPG